MIDDELDGDVEVGRDLSMVGAPTRGRTTSRLNSSGSSLGTKTSSLQDYVPQIECQPNLQLPGDLVQAGAHGPLDLVAAEQELAWLKPPTPRFVT